MYYVIKVLVQFDRSLVPFDTIHSFLTSTAVDAAVRASLIPDCSELCNKVNNLSHHPLLNSIQINSNFIPFNCFSLLSTSNEICSLNSSMSHG